ncbi:MAG TPA: tyrosine-type recombinase/integrase [Desulfuromonadales bacterium]|nr:tyrosine-type recombinase/integrase [Desulfuromonadales bacterium]
MGLLTLGIQLGIQEIRGFVIFHSMRHTVADTLKQAGVPEVVISEILGHTHMNITSGRYGKRYQPKVLLEALAKLDYDVKI